MNNEINVRTLCTGIKTSEPMTRERSHDIRHTRLLKPVYTGDFCGDFCDVKSPV